MDFTTVIWAVVVLGALAIVFGLILAVAAKVFEVEVDPRLPEIQACLAGANCGGCGYPGCGGCAEAILAGKAPINACAPAGAEGAAKIAAIMGMEAPTGEKMVAHVLCNGGTNAVKNFEYRGVNDCLAATKVLAGDALACKYGCLGFGSCPARATTSPPARPSAMWSPSRPCPTWCAPLPAPCAPSTRTCWTSPSC